MRVLRILIVLAVTTVTLSLGSPAQEKKATPKETPEFDVQGISMTECQCTAYMYPCRSNGHPDHGSCDAADFVWIKSGHYGKVDTSGFKAVMVGDVIDTDASKVQGTVYFDEKATPEQRAAYSEMIGFMFGWNPPNVVGTKTVKLDFGEASGKTEYTLTIPGILEERAVMKRDKNGNPLHEVPASSRALARWLHDT